MTSFRTLLFVFLLLACAPAAYAVDELDVWWEFRGGGEERSWAGAGFSYLPDFDTLNGGEGHNAIAMITGFPQDDSTGGCETWYLREQGDRENYFSWWLGDARDIGFGDFDGDGVRDYFTWAGRLFRGRVNGLPPDTPYVAQYPEVFDRTSVYMQVLDLNRDGYDDAVVRSGTLFDEVGRILFGGPDLTALQVAVIADNYTAYRKEEFFIGFPRTPSRRGRQTMVTQVAQLDTGIYIRAVEISFVLWELNVRREADTLVIERVLLDSISDAAMRPEDGFDYVTAAVMFNSVGGYDFIAIPNLDKTVVNLFRVFDDQIVADKVFEPSTNPASTVIPLTGSVNGDSTPDWGFGTSHGFVVCSAFDANLDRSIEIGRIVADCEGPATVRAIGDVTGDGIGDLATSQSHPGACFRIYRGVNLGTAVAPRPAAPRGFALGQHHPNPAARGGHVVVPLEIERGGRYRLALYDLRGAFITHFFDSELPPGNHELPLSLGGLDLRAGFYLLRLTGAAGGAHERGLLVR